MNKFTQVIILALLCSSITAMPKETFSEYAARFYAFGEYQGSFASRKNIKSMCSHVRYPGTQLMVPKWLEKQLNQAEQDNPNYPQSVASHEIKMVYNTPQFYKNSENPWPEEECIKRADFYVDLIRYTVEENIKNINNHNYTPFNITAYSNRIKRHELSLLIF